ncbi:amidohydrolase [Corynebacterium accolens]|uniref:amidohydrolase n=1 Tax=Corynebacterium accolens TaxID=38284 RepID=UPI00266F848C|nr:amidohydrolase [Corynebacterium accolens]WKS68313.1 amidohydrolase [Corynebacterium accolens]WKS70751.1 amidohydrolase [Corynebacterium accolens]WKS72979.1 amidohydrolase [Corynebacterium accolens]
MQFSTIIRNVHLPLTETNRLYDIAVFGEQIANIAPAGEAPFASSAHTEFDAEGSYALPGFNDVHAHSVWFGETLLEISLADARKCSTVYDTLKRSLDEVKGEWIIASGFNPHLLDDGPLDINTLDSITKARPLLIKHNSGHAITVNSEALERAGIGSHPEQKIEGGTINVDESGKATGVLDENAMRPINELLEPKSLPHLEKALAAASKVYAAEGLTSVTDAGIAGGWIGHSPLELQAYQNARDNNLLRHRVQTMITLDALHDLPHHADDPEALTLDTGMRTGLGDNRLQIGPTKIFTDGSILGTTAAMSHDYCQCAGNSGYFQHDPEAMQASALRAAASGWSLAMHALGDAAVDLAIDTIDKATAAYGRPAIPHRIEHGGVTTDAQVQRIAELDIALAPQPHFIKAFGDSMAELLGPDRVKDSYPAKRLLDAGAVLPGSSDRPVAEGAPLKVIQSFVERLTSSNNAYSPAERISVRQAIDAYTIGSARATGWSGHKGKIEEGFLADITFLQQNPLETPTEQLSTIPINATMRGGEIIHRA